MYRPHQGDGRPPRALLATCWASRAHSRFHGSEGGKWGHPGACPQPQSSGSWTREWYPRQGGHRGSTLLVQSLGPFLSSGSISILLIVCYVPLTPEFSGTLFLPILIICQGEWGRQEINRVRFTISYVLDFHTGVPMNPGDFPDLIHA